MARRANAKTPELRHVEFEGEWVKLRNYLDYEAVLTLESAKAQGDMALILSLLIASWSFEDEAGQMLPVSIENVKDNKDAPVLVNALVEMESLPFLGQMSHLASRKS